VEKGAVVVEERVVGRMLLRDGAVARRRRVEETTVLVIRAIY
jgi:hypothetical protein